MKRAQTRNEQVEEIVHAEQAGGRIGVGHSTALPVIKVSVSKQSLILQRGRKKLRIPRERILFVQTQRSFLCSEIKVVHSQPDVPAAIGIMSFDPERLLRLFSSLGIRVDDRAGISARPARARVMPYVRVAGGLLLLTAGLAGIVALTVWATRTVIMATQMLR